MRTSIYTTQQLQLLKTMATLTADNVLEEFKRNDELGVGLEQLDEEV